MTWIGKYGACVSENGVCTAVRGISCEESVSYGCELENNLYGLEDMEVCSGKVCDLGSSLLGYAIRRCPLFLLF